MSINKLTSLIKSGGRATDHLINSFGITREDIDTAINNGLVVEKPIEGMKRPDFTIIELVKKSDINDFQNFAQRDDNKKFKVVDLTGAVESYFFLMSDATGRAKKLNKLWGDIVYTAYVNNSPADEKVLTRIFNNLKPQESHDVATINAADPLLSPLDAVRIWLRCPVRGRG